MYRLAIKESLDKKFKKLQKKDKEMLYLLRSSLVRSLSSHSRESGSPQRLAEARIQSFTGFRVKHGMTKYAEHCGFTYGLLGKS